MEGDLKLASFQSLECPVCLSTFNDPKILSCSHTFCKACLDHLVKSHDDEQKILCPVCRVETTVPGRDVCLLQTNLAVKSLLEDVKSHYQVCTDCEAEEKPQAVVYCQDCGKYLCITCQAKHSQWDSWSDHEVLDLKEIASGKVLVRKYRKCRKHPREDEECFCSDCRRFACFRCILKEHVNEKHEVMEASTYASAHRARVEELTSKANDKHARIRKYMDYIDEQRGSMQNVKKQCMVDISEAYEESALQLREQKEYLLQEVLRKNNEADAALGRLMETAQQQMAHVTTMTDLVANRKKIPLETVALAAHDSLCEGLQEALKHEEPDYKEPSTSSKQGKCIAFERNKGQDELGLGMIVHSCTLKKCVELPVFKRIVGVGELGLGKIVNSVAKNIALPTKHSMDCMVATPDGRMAVGCFTGGIDIFSTDGQLQTVLKKIYIDSLAFLSDGRHVVQDTNNNITLYTTEYEKLDVRFETLNRDEVEGGSGGFDVDRDDHIYMYVSYRKVKKIQVFSPAGGKAIREIPCHGYIPQQITMFDDLLIIKHGKAISMIDNDGNAKHRVTKTNKHGHATVTRDNRILIAWVSHDEGFVSIDEYNKELQHVKTLIPDYKIERPDEERNWYCLQEFRSGEIAFCTPDRLYIFH